MWYENQLFTSCLRSRPIESSLANCNDFVAGLKFKNGREAEGYFAWTFPDGTIVSWDNAIFNIKNVAAGESTAVGPLEFDVLSNGKPTITPAL